MAIYENKVNLRMSIVLMSLRGVRGANTPKSSKNIENAPFSHFAQLPLYLTFQVTYAQNTFSLKIALPKKKPKV
jgi:hypothetical protein